MLYDMTFWIYVGYHRENMYWGIWKKENGNSWNILINDKLFIVNGFLFFIP